MFPADRLGCATYLNRHSPQLLLLWEHCVSARCGHNLHASPSVSAPLIKKSTLLQRRLNVNPVACLAKPYDANLYINKTPIGMPKGRSLQMTYSRAIPLSRLKTMVRVLKIRTQYGGVPNSNPPPRCRGQLSSYPPHVLTPRSRFLDQQFPRSVPTWACFIVL